MNRNDIIKLVAHQLQDDVRRARAKAKVLMGLASKAFRKAVRELAIRKNKGQNLYMLAHVGRDLDTVIEVEVHYHMTHDELASPRDHCKVTFRDGTPWDQSYEFMVRQDFNNEILTLRNCWIKAQKNYMAALAAGERMTDVKQDAWKRVVDGVLDGTECGKRVKDAVSALRAELKRDGFEAIAEELGVKNVTEG